MKKQTERKLYSLKELYWIVYKAMRTIRYLSKAKKNKELSPGFIERIMIAVTEVNGCAICSYAHARMALEAGMSNEEIQNMLSGITTDIPAEELAAVMFAQYYAESRGKPSKESWDRILEAYGQSKAYGILGAVRIIMLGNAYGIPWSSFFSRFKGKQDKRSSFFYETLVIIPGSVIIPLAMVHAIIASLLRLKIIDFHS